MAVQIKVRLQSMCQSESVNCNINRIMARLCAPTFSRSWRSCLPLASLEHRFCSGATTVQMQRPSASWVELYTCHPSFGRMVCIQEHRHSCEYKGHMPTDRHTQQFPPRRCHSHEIAALNCYVFSFLSSWFITSSALCPSHTNTKPFHWLVRTRCCWKITLYLRPLNFLSNKKLCFPWFLLTRPPPNILPGDADKADLWVLFPLFSTVNLLHSSGAESIIIKLCITSQCASDFSAAPSTNVTQ